MSSRRQGDRMTTEQDRNKALVLEAFDVLFNKRDYAAAARYCPEDYIQHSTHVRPGRDGLFDLIQSLPETLRYENQAILADGDQVMLYGRFGGTGLPAAMITADVLRIQDGKLAEHWDVWEDEATRADSLSELPMFGDQFPAKPHGVGRAHHVSVGVPADRRVLLAVGLRACPVHQVHQREPVRLDWRWPLGCTGSPAAAVQGTGRPGRRCRGCGRPRAG
jgi:predicted SnoaL-like aldol condensation-catalyzing enzyme